MNQKKKKNVKSNLIVPKKYKFIAKICNIQ